MLTSPEKELSIYIADDHPIVVDGLQEILKSKQHIKVKGVAYDGENLIDLLKKETVDIVILDINMPRLSGIQCAKWIKENLPTVKVLILTMYPERVLADQLLKAGADGCLLKSRGTKDLLDAIERVSSGKSYFDWVSDFKTDVKVAQNYNLSEREIEIIKQAISGKTSSEIANNLFISEETVKTHRKNIFKKLGIHHVTELVTFAINNGIK
jgi:DNA-binding NarL/FixJ family response regulator